MKDLNAAASYDRELTHLVRAHGAEADLLVGYALNLTQFRWAHFDTHAALDIAQVRPPDGHIHPALPDPGGPGQPLASYRPFLPSPALARWALPLSAPCRFVADSTYTGLPQTGATPPANDLADVTGCWPAEAIALTMSRARRGLDPERVLAEYRGELKNLADAAAARWLAGANFPGQVKFRGLIFPGRRSANRTQQRVPQPGRGRGR
jgi:hypothetical protein